MPYPRRKVLLVQLIVSAAVLISLLAAAIVFEVIAPPHYRLTVLGCTFLGLATGFTGVLVYDRFRALCEHG